MTLPSVILISLITCVSKCFSSLLIDIYPLLKPKAICSFVGLYATQRPFICSIELNDKLTFPKDSHFFDNKLYRRILLSSPTETIFFSLDYHPHMDNYINAINNVHLQHILIF